MSRGAPSYIDMDFNRLKLIEAVKKRQKLWDNTTADREVKMTLWREVGQECFSDWDQLSKTEGYDRILYLQRKWRSFRDAYARELRWRKTGKRCNKSVYKYFKHLLFLGGHEDLNIDIESLESIDLDDTTTDIIISSFSENNVKSKRKMKKEPSTDDDEDNDDEVEMEMEVPLYDTLNTEGEKETDSDKLFLLSFLPEMKQLPMNLRMWARSQIANVMQEAVNCQYSKTNPGNISFKRPRKDSSD